MYFMTLINLSCTFLISAPHISLPPRSYADGMAIAHCYALLKKILPGEFLPFYWWLHVLLLRTNMKRYVINLAAPSLLTLNNLQRSKVTFEVTPNAKVYI